MATTVYVTGTVTPDVTGTYAANGTYNGKTAYTNGSYWLWYDSGFMHYSIAVDKGGTVLFSRAWVTGAEVVGSYYAYPASTGTAKAGTSSPTPPDAPTSTDRTTRPRPVLPSRTFALIAATSETGEHTAVVNTRGTRGRLLILHSITDATTGGEITLTMQGVEESLSGGGPGSSSYSVVAPALTDEATITLDITDGTHEVHGRIV